MNLLEWQIVILKKIKNYLKTTPQTLLLARDGIAFETISRIKNENKIEPFDGRENDFSPLLQIHKIEYHFNLRPKIFKGFKEIDEKEIEIKHFKNMMINLNLGGNREQTEQELKNLESAIAQILRGSFGNVEFSETEKKLLNSIRNRTFDELKTDEISFESIEKFAKENEIDLKTLIAANFGTISKQYLGNLNPVVCLKNLQSHYYNPIILSTENQKYKHIIKVPSEINFLDMLEYYLNNNEVAGFDWWYFSKIDDSLDENIFIPYYDSHKQEYRKFRPDFIFWFKKGEKYWIKFVDPKGLQLAQDITVCKVKGLEKIKTESKGYKIKLSLLFHNQNNIINKTLEKLRFWEIEELFNENKQGKI